MFKIKRITVVIIGIVGLLGAGLAGVIFSRDPGGCKPEEAGTEDVTQMWQPVHLFLAGEESRLILTDGQVTELVRTRLSPKVTALAICFDNDLVWVTGMAENNSGWRVRFWVQGKPQLSDGRLQLIDVNVKLGSSDQIPGLTPLFSRMAQGKINDYLQSLKLAESYKLQVAKGEITLWRD